MGKNDNLGELEQLALLAVMRLGPDAYGARIQEELDRTAGRSAAISSIYITLMRLESKGLVRSEMRVPSEGGKARRYFEVGPEGRAALQDARERLLSMWSGLEGELESA